MSRYRKEQKFIRRLTKKISKSLMASFEGRVVGEPMLVEDITEHVRTMTFVAKLLPAVPDFIINIDMNEVSK